MIYRPVAGWQGIDSYDYTVVDRDGSSDRGSVIVTVGNGIATAPLPPPEETESEPDPLPEPTPTPPPTTGSMNPVEAGDDFQRLEVNKDLYHNAKYMLMNDKGQDGGLRITAVDSTSREGTAVSFSSDGTVIYRSLNNWQGVDTFDYSVVDRDGSSDRGTIIVTVGNGGSGAQADNLLPASFRPDDFVIQPGQGNDTIAQFEVEEDQIVLSGFGPGLDSFAEVSARLQADSDHTLIDLGAGSVLLLNVAPSSLMAEHFLFG